MYKLLLIKQYKTKLLVCLLMIFVLTFGLNYIFENYIYNPHPSTIANNLAYYEGNNQDEVIASANQNGVKVNRVVPYTYNKEFVSNFTYAQETDQNIALNGLEYLDQTSLELINQVGAAINRNIMSIDIVINYFVSDQTLDQIDVPNQNLGIDYLLFGDYPNAENQILIPEVYGLYLVTKEGLSSYEQLLNQPVTFEVQGSTQNYIISGIYSGSAYSIYAPINDQVREMYKQEGLDLNQYYASVLTFDNKQERDEFTYEHPQFEFVTSKQFIFQNILNYIIYVFVIVVAGLYMLLIRKNVKSSVNTLNHYAYSRKNFILLYGQHFVLVSLVMIVAIRLSTLI